MAVMISFAKISVIVIFSRISACTGCTEPQPVLHAYRHTDNTSLPEGSWVNYTCYQNYYLTSGDVNRQCKDGDFTGEPPVCDEYKILIPADAAVPKPGSSGGDLLIDGDVLSCAGTGSSTEPSWTIEFGGMKHVFSVELNLDLISIVNIDRIEVHVRNTTENPTLLCGSVDLPLASSYVKFECPLVMIGSHLVIQGGGLLGTLGLCEVTTRGKDWLYECGDPLFVYGAEVTSNGISGTSVVVQYSCVEGFYYGGKNPESTCRNGQWTKVEILCLPYDSLYNSKMAPFLTEFSNLVDDDENTCAKSEDHILEDPTLHFRRMNFKIYLFKPVELLSVTVTIEVNETWEDVDFVGSFIPNSKFEEYEAPLCEYDGSNTDPYRTRTFYCQPYAYTQLMYIINRDISSHLKVFCELKSTIRIDTAALECIRGEYVNEYKGKMNYTLDGKLCNNWADAPPDKAINTTIHKIFDPDAELNYCRNIGGEKIRPWCWVDNFKSVGYCPLAFCNEICHLKEEYTEYKGQQFFSTSGKQCRKWSNGNELGEQFLSDVFSDGTQSGPYCRNPGYSQFRSWCYVDGPASTIVPEPCDFPQCPTDFLQLIVRNNETSNYPIYLHHCYSPLDSFNVQHYFNLTIDQSTVNNFCRNFQDKLMFCFTGGGWKRVEFQCFDVPPESTTLVEETTSLSPETTFLSEETSFLETSSDVEVSSTVAESSSETSSTIPTSSPMSTSFAKEASSLIEISSSMVIDDTSAVPTSSFVETSSSLDVRSSAEASSSMDSRSSLDETSAVSSSFPESNSLLETSSAMVESSTVPTSSSVESISSISSSSSVDDSTQDETSLLDLSSTLETTLNPSFSSTAMDTASETSPLPETANMDTSSNTNEMSATLTATPTLDSASSSFWYSVSNTGRNLTCGYFCIREELLNTTDSVVKARLEFLTRSLEMDYEKLSATIRKRISAEDDRPSVMYVGSSALVIMVVFLILIVFPDVINLLKFIQEQTKCGKTKGTSDTEKSGS